MYREDKEYFKCDCGNELEFEKIIEELDRYEEVILCVGEYSCPKCFEEYNLNIEVPLSEFDSLNK